MEDIIRTPQDIGRTVRALRQGQKMTETTLGKRAELSQSKISKIETGMVKLAPNEIEKILDILNCPKTIRQQIAAVYELDSTVIGTKYRPLLYTPHAVYKRELDTTHLRCAVLSAIPVLLQTTTYHEAMLSRMNITPKESARRMHFTTKRQDLLWHKKHSFHFVMHETALYTTPGGREVQVPQLDRLERLCATPRIKIGITPLEAGLPTLESSSSFILYDNRLVVQVIGSHELASDDPQDITEYVKVFSEFDQKACYDHEARSLVRKAMDFFI